MEFTNTTLLYGLFNQYVFSEAKMNLQSLIKYYKNAHLYENNTLVTRLLKLIETYNYLDLTESRFILTLQEDGKTADEANMIYKKIKEFQGYNKEQSAVFIENLRNMCYKAHVDQVQKLYADNPVKYVEELKKFDYRSNYSDKLIAKNFSELDITDLVNRYSAEGYKSRYDIINKSYTCGGYLPAQLVLVCAAPSVGKSLFLQSEAVNFIQQGKRVHMLTMGDLNELDLAIRMMCQISHKSQRAVESDILGNYILYQQQFKDYLSMTTVPSGLVSAREYVDWMKQRADEYDILMIDYYSNFGQNEELSMYQNGGEICDSLTELTRLGKLVFMACQPKQSYFGEELIPYDGIGESSRLPHIADMIVTFGRNWDAGMRMGKFNIAKNRKGIAEAETTCPWIGTNEGLFYMSSEALYAKFRTDHRRRLFSYNELSTMDIIDESIKDILPATLDEKEKDKEADKKDTVIPTV